MKFEIQYEFRASLKKFQDLNFWDATAQGEKDKERQRVRVQELIS
jgi:hypothetical protein